MTNEEYVKSRGQYCPFCGQPSIEGYQIEIIHGTAIQECTCMTCNEEWQDIYYLVGFERNE